MQRLERKARPDQSPAPVVDCRHPHCRVVAERAAAPRRMPQVARHGVHHHTRLQRSVQACGYRYGIHRVLVQEVGRAIQRIDDPCPACSMRGCGPCAVGARRRCLLRHDRVVGEISPDNCDDLRFGFVIDVRDEVRRSLFSPGVRAHLARIGPVNPCCGNRRVPGAAQNGTQIHSRSFNMIAVCRLTSNLRE